MPLLHEVRVDLGARAYNVRVGSGLLSELGPRWRSRWGASRGVIIADDALLSRAEFMAGSLAQSSLSCAILPVRAGEHAKTLATAERLLADCAVHRLERGEPIIALGGGVVGDLAGFVAATYKRGTPIVQCPTTLLAMVDASVGGKTAVNLHVPDPHAPPDVQAGQEIQKNAVGVFHQPVEVVIDLDTLSTLPQRHLRAGLAECIKHAMLGRVLGDPDFFAWLESNLDTVLSCSVQAIAELVARNVAMKARMIERDERETAPDSGRALLNLGHTFAHAIETWPTLANAPVLHGEAVALGLLAAGAAARAMGLLNHAYPERVAAILSRAGLATTTTGLPDNETILARMLRDKKSRGGKLRLILPTGDGVARVFEAPPRDAVLAGISAMRA